MMQKIQLAHIKIPNEKTNITQKGIKTPGKKKKKKSTWYRREFGISILLGRTKSLYEEGEENKQRQTTKSNRGGKVCSLEFLKEMCYAGH